MNETNTEIQAWETEDAVIVVWGTHEPKTASYVANQWYRENIGEPLEDGTFMTPEDFEGSCAKYWGHPDAPEHEVWGDALWSREPVVGFIPYLAVDR